MPPGRQFPLAGSFHQSFFRLLQIVALFLMSDTRMQNGPFCDTYCTVAWTRDTLFFLYDVVYDHNTCMSVQKNFRNSYSRFSSLSLRIWIHLSSFNDLYLRFSCHEVSWRLLFACLRWLLLSHISLILRDTTTFLVWERKCLYLSFLENIWTFWLHWQGLTMGCPLVKSKSLITCVICSRVVSSLELFGVHLLRTWNKSERWCHSLNIRQGPSRLPFAVNQ